MEYEVYVGLDVRDYLVDFLMFGLSFFNKPASAVRFSEIVRVCVVDLEVLIK